MSAVLRAVMVGGVQMVAVTQQTAMWLWPTANTGPYNNSAGIGPNGSGASHATW